jgi:hypothetical protein
MVEPFDPDEATVEADDGLLDVDAASEVELGAVPAAPMVK